MSHNWHIHANKHLGFFYMSNCWLIHTNSMNLRFCLLSPDNHVDWSPEDGAAAAIGSCGPEVGSLLGVRCGGSFAIDGDLRPHRSLAGLHMVRHREHGAEHGPRGTAEDWLVGRASQANETVLQCIGREQWAHHQVEIRDSFVLYLQQLDKRGLRQCVAQYQFREDIFDPHHVDRM